MNLVSSLLGKIIALLLALAIFFVSCDKEESSPVEYSGNASIRNTFQSQAFNFPDEFPYGDTLTSALGANVEFPAYLGFYKVDIGNSEISFELLASAASDPMISSLFRVIEPGTFDRYYITFDKAQAFKTASTNNAAVKAIVLSNQELKIEIGEGYNFSPGNAVFTVTLDK